MTAGYYAGGAKGENHRGHVEQITGAIKFVLSVRLMSFPYHDPLWTEAAAFVERRASGSDSILARDLFWWRFSKIYRYINTRLRPEQDYDWITRVNQIFRFSGWMPTLCVPQTVASTLSFS
jgi:hypothetical protein